MSSSRPAVSVVLAVLDGEPYLQSALESIGRQTFTDFECVVVDDGSTDRTPHILSRWSREDPRFRVIRQERRGQVPALHRGIGEARAPYIARMDADDLSRPTRLERQVQFLDEHPRCAAVGSAIQIVDESGRAGKRIQHPRKLASMEEVLEAGRIMPHPAVTYRLSCFRAVGGYREVFHSVEDTDLWLRFSEHHWIGNLPEVLLDYRKHSSSMTRSAPRMTRIKEFVVRGLAHRRLLGGDWYTPEASELLTLAMELGEEAIQAESGMRNPWMSDARVRRILRDLLLLDPSLSRRSRRLLHRMARRQVREFRWLGAVKSWCYGFNANLWPGGSLL